MCSKWIILTPILTCILRRKAGQHHFHSNLYRNLRGRVHYWVVSLPRWRRGQRSLSDWVPHSTGGGYWEEDYWPVWLDCGIFNWWNHCTGIGLWLVLPHNPPALWLSENSFSQHVFCNMSSISVFSHKSICCASINVIVVELAWKTHEKFIDLHCCGCCHIIRI